jgi:hypothetical protein
MGEFKKMVKMKSGGWISETKNAKNNRTNVKNFTKKDPKKLGTVTNSQGKKMETVKMKSGGSTGDNWIEGAIKKPGSLRKSLGVKKGNKIPMAKLESAAHKKGKLGKRARLAETLRGFHKKG